MEPKANNDDHKILLCDHGVPIGPTIGIAPDGTTHEIPRRSCAECEIDAARGVLHGDTRSRAELLNTIAELKRQNRDLRRIGRGVPPPIVSGALETIFNTLMERAGQPGGLFPMEARYGIPGVRVPFPRRADPGDCDDRWAGVPDGYRVEQVGPADPDTGEPIGPPYPPILYPPSNQTRADIGRRARGIVVLICSLDAARATKMLAGFETVIAEDFAHSRCEP